MNKEDPAALHWVTGPEYTAVRLRGGAHWLLTRNFVEGKVPLAVHLQLLQGVLSDDPGAIPALKGRSVELPKLGIGLLVLAFLALIASWFLLSEAIASGSNPLLAGDSFRLLLGGALLVWLSLVLSDGLWLRHCLDGTAQPLRVWFFAPRIDAVHWVVLGRRAPAWFSLLLPLLALAVGLSGLVPARFGAGMAGAGFLLFALRSCPLAYGPLSSLLGRWQSTQDFPRSVRLALAAALMPGEVSLLRSSRPLIVTGLVATATWALMVFVGLGFFRAHPGSTSLLDLAWMHSWRVVSVLIGLWFLLILSDVVRASLRLRMRGKIESLEPDHLQLRRWRESCALLYQVPSMDGLRWQWFRVETGHPLVRRGGSGEGCWWVASGALEMVGRDGRGNLELRGFVRAGSAFAHGLMDEDVAVDFDLVASEPCVVAYLDLEHVRLLPPEALRKVRSFVQSSLSFDRCPTLAGIHPVLKELWLAKGRLVVIPGGTILMETGEEATWMALVVQGTLDVEGMTSLERNSRLESASLVGGEILSGVPRRTKTLVSKDAVTLLRWEYSWVRQWVPAEGTVRDGAKRPTGPLGAVLAS